MKRKFKGFTGSMVVALLLAVSLILGGCSSGKSSKAGSETAEPYKVGAVLDISGTSSSLGTPERDTLLMMVDKINAEGGIQGHPIELIIEDNKSDEMEAVLAANKLIEKGVLAVLGGSSSGTSMAIMKTVQDAQIPMISLAAASSIVEPAAERQWVFKTAQSDIVMINKIIEYLKKNNMTKIAFMYMNNAYGDNGKKAISAAAPQNGITIVAEEKFDATDNDMTPQLTNVKSSGAQAVVVWAIPPSASILTKNYKDLGLTIPLIHSHGVGNQKFIELAQDAADGVILPIGKLPVTDQIADSDPQKAVLTSYINDYQNKYNTAPNSFGGYAADALSLLVKAIEKAGPDRSVIRNELEKTQGLVGVSGVFNMSEQDHNGLSEDSAVLVQIEDGKWKILQ
ncbi:MULTISPECIES: ABC transporter substrate-binding protein [Dehalobacter]|uniref:ABC transporter substrate-binding protein n=2 Tax=Dehalobacter restrictus TaxID=55583 RepID=A0A857DPI0_9FIRM|nr:MULTISPECIES: ABC transporter substrate-binding protein [Dehalobacter]AHF09189.1 ABC transporter substrate-binding protein [Dehalobacter restrictus DSM 9455]MCG1025809.1 ABC transporter substrate-binding protein [Dehalobacter sp.]MDJ0306471.1 ABC transporter substrate-binding protein [Dehalobacter sp.]OCZ51306.1 ABC transporter substrate-binding protein [Dehalobacter sp. TeCB1]QHA01856.1 ABC transporter substrate-binding protein [Dehalobacter restrictus]